MDIEYRRKLSKNKRTKHKECAKCGTVWCDEHILNTNHDYGENSCPFCHLRWESETIIKLATPKPRQSTINYYIYK